LLSAPDDANKPTLIVAGPERPLSRAEAEHLEHWLGGGGQLLLLSANGWPLREAVKAPSSRSGSGDETGPGETETFLSRFAPSLRWTSPGPIKIAGVTGSSIPGEEIALGWHRSFSGTGDAKVAATAPNAVIAVELPIGQGRIIAIADPAMASNAALRRSDNAVWLVSLAAAWGNGRVLFDEYHHGFGQKRGVVELTGAFLMTPWGWCVLQLAAAGLLYIFGYRRRFGAIREVPAPPRTSPLELLAARAGVLEAAAAQGLAADLIIQHLCQSLSRSRRKAVDAANLSHELAVLAKNDTPLLVALEALFGKLKNGRRLSDREWIEFGRNAGEAIRRSRP
jgi:hypothetical protein